MCACRLLCCVCVCLLKRSSASDSERRWRCWTAAAAAAPICAAPSSGSFAAAAVRGRTLCEYWRNVIFSLCWKERRMFFYVWSIVWEGREPLVCVCLLKYHHDRVNNRSQSRHFFLLSLVLLEIGHWERSVRYYTCKSLIFPPSYDNIFQTLSNIIICLGAYLSFVVQTKSLLE